MLRFQLLDFQLRCRLTAQGLTREVVPVQLHRLSGLLVEVVHGVTELIFLQLQLLASCGDLHQRRPDLRDLLEHLLVAEVEHLTRVFGFVQRSVRFGFDNVVSTFEKTHYVSSDEVGTFIVRLLPLAAIVPNDESIPGRWSPVAELKREGDGLVVVLSTAEKLEAAHGDVRVPVSSVTGVEVVEDVVHAVPGLKVIGAGWPGRFAIGTYSSGPGGEKTFVVVHHDNSRGVKVRLDGERFDQLVISCADPEYVASNLRIS